VESKMAVIVVSMSFFIFFSFLKRVSDGLTVYF